MKNPIIECIANYSEGRRPEVIEAIAQAIQSTPGVLMLDRHSDTDHNRSVLTFIGPPQGVEEAAYQSIVTAARLIDLDQHRGEHPRIGATDVVPFVPIRDATMEDCIAIARRLGKRVGDGLQIPVYLYEEAAARPERKNLEHIRRGEFEALKQEIETNPDRSPDFGPQRLGPAGATVIGARHPLIAFNVYLNTHDLSIAKQIARAVRHSSGGLRYVKALEMLVDDRAQVSMNLTNYRATPLARVVELIRLEAQRYGTSIHHTELVGLIPQEALNQAAVWYLQLDQYQPGQILEQRMFELGSEMPQKPDNGFLEELASGSPVPGGGSAAAFAGAQAAALAAMVARVTIGKKKYAEHEPQMLAVAEQADQLRNELSQAVEQDADAFTKVLEALRLPKDTPEGRQSRKAAIHQATLNAIRVPLQVADYSVQVLELVECTTRLGNLNAISDSGAASALAHAALASASLNVRINAASLEDPGSAQEYLKRLDQLQARAASLETAIRQSLATRGGFPL